MLAAYASTRTRFSSSIFLPLILLIFAPISLRINGSSVYLSSFIYFFLDSASSRQFPVRLLSFPPLLFLVPSFSMSSMYSYDYKFIDSRSAVLTSTPWFVVFDWCLPTAVSSMRSRDPIDDKCWEHNSRKNRTQSEKNTTIRRFIDRTVHALITFPMRWLRKKIHRSSKSSIDKYWYIDVAYRFLFEFFEAKRISSVGFFNPFTVRSPFTYLLRLSDHRWPLFDKSDIAKREPTLWPSLLEKSSNVSCVYMYTWAWVRLLYTCNRIHTTMCSPCNTRVSKAEGRTKVDGRNCGTTKRRSEDKYSVWCTITV